MYITTIDKLDVALRLRNIEVHKTLLIKIITVYKAIEEKENITTKDIIDLKS